MSSSLEFCHKTAILNGTVFRDEVRMRSEKAKPQSSARGVVLLLSRSHKNNLIRRPPGPLPRWSLEPSGKPGQVWRYLTRFDSSHLSISAFLNRTRRPSLKWGRSRLFISFCRVERLILRYSISSSRVNRLISSISITILTKSTKSLKSLIDKCSRWHIMVINSIIANQSSAG
jgi:hypothetical protein